MIKQILFATLTISSISTIYPNLIDSKSNQNHTTIKTYDEINNKIVFDIIRDLTLKKFTNGSTLKHGEKMQTALPLLWNTINSVKANAKRTAEKIPTVGPSLVRLIENINSGHLTLIDENKLLTSGENIPRVNLKIAESSFEMPMIIINVT